MQEGRTRSGSAFAYAEIGYDAEMLISNANFSSKTNGGEAVWNDWFFGTTAASAFKPYFANQLGNFIGVGIT